MKILSIIVPSYNMEQYLPKCLGSLIVDDPELLQKLDVIVVNDGSTDRTSEIAHEFESRYPGVFRVIDKSNGNYGSCINAALPVVQGVYVKVLDADDWFDSKVFQRFLTFILKIDDAELVLSDYKMVDVFGSVLRECRCGFSTEAAFPVGEFLRTGSSLYMHAYTYKTSIFQGLHYKQCEGVSYSDWEWTLVPLVNVHCVRYFPSAVYMYLNGRAGQTTELVAVSKNWWMLGEVALDCLFQIQNFLVRVETNVCEMILEKIQKRIELTYRAGIFDVAPSDAGYLRDFDCRLKNLSLDVYNRCENIPYSRFVPYRFVKSWRQDMLISHIMIPVCKVSTAMANIMRRFI